MGSMITSMGSFLSSVFLRPKSTNDELAHRGVIYTILIVCSVVLAFIALLFSVYAFFTDSTHRGIRISPIFTFVFFSFTLTIIIAVFWLFNSEIRKALHRVQKSEGQLKKERDLLEVKVEERTKELRQLELEKNIQVYRFAEIGKITSGMFHDLVNPLNLISLNLEALYTKTQKDRKEEFREIENNLQRAIMGTRRLENFVNSARQQIIQNRDIETTFSLFSEIEKVVEMLKPMAEKRNIQISIIHDEDIELHTNPIRFNQMILNLVRNAIEAYYEGDENAKNTIEITLKKNANTGVITVTDWGKGIPKEHLKKIFNPFFSTKKLESGLGIGLYLVQNTVENNLHGTISVESQKGITVFTVTFPLQNITLMNQELP
jgi:signal transduction histidine kinase